MTAAGVVPSTMASDWVKRLENPDAVCAAVLGACYGEDSVLLGERRALILRVVAGFMAQYGDAPLRIFRAPGRINLRGMHVDTHGGFLNLMTHQREVVMAVQARANGGFEFSNVDSQYPAVLVRPGHVEKGFGGGHWGNYLEGALSAFQEAAPDARLVGWRACVGSDISTGTGLSSSHALCVATLEAAAALSGIGLLAEAKILAARAAEWHTGARTGVSDQTPMILAKRGTVLHGAILAEDLDLGGMRSVPFPEALCVLVIDSRTKRNLSGAAQVAYGKNRFAYSAALGIFNGISGHDAVDRFSKITPQEFGGDAALLGLMKRVPLTAHKNDLVLDARLSTAYSRLFGDLDPAEQPEEFNVRGPLLFGLAESERARRFPGCLEAGDFAAAGALLSAGHDGDRVRDVAGGPYRCAVDDSRLDAYIQSGVSVAAIPGAYGASSPALDGIVDAACEAGALGACLTGAGIAGSVLALCYRERAESIRAAVSTYLASAAYAGRRGAPIMTRSEAEAAVSVNHSVAAAGELRLDLPAMGLRGTGKNGNTRV